MCQGGNPLYKVAQFDSRNLLQLGKALGIKPLEQEAEYNIKNPGHAISTAAEYALGGYLGSAAAGALGGGAAGVAGAAPVAGTTAADFAAQQAAAQSLAAMMGENVGSVLPEVVGETPGAVSDLSTQAGLLDKAKYAFSNVGGGKGSAGAARLAATMGQGLLNGQPQPQPQGRPFMPAQQSTSSSGFSGYAPVQAPQIGSQGQQGQLSELQRQRYLAQLRAQGYPV
jgi:hypothetical protein